MGFHLEYQIVVHIVFVLNEDGNRRNRSLESAVSWRVRFQGGSASDDKTGRHREGGLASESTEGNIEAQREQQSRWLLDQEGYVMILPHLVASMRHACESYSQLIQRAEELIDLQ